MVATLEALASEWHSLYTVGGIVSFVLLVYSLVTMVLLVTVGGQPKTAAEGFAMLKKNKVIGLLRLDILVFVMMPSYYVLFLALYAALREAHPAYALLSTVLAFAGVTLVLANPSALSFVTLGKKYEAATSEEQKSQLLAAGEAVLASDLWHGTGAHVGVFSCRLLGCLSPF